jgi:hypothetical protein
MTPQINTDHDFVEMIKVNVLLPEEQLIEIVSHDIPEVLTSPSLAKIVLKYIHLFAYNHVLNLIRYKIYNEFKHKKAVPMPTGCRGFRLEDDLYLQKKITLKGHSSLNIYRQVGNIKSILEDLFFKEMKMEGLISTDKWLNMYGTYFRNCNEENIPMFCEKWWEYSPELLSDSTNYLTYYDKKTMECIPILLKKLLQDINHHPIHKQEINKNLKRLEKYIAYY